VFSQAHRIGSKYARNPATVAAARAIACFAVGSEAVYDGGVHNWRGGASALPSVAVSDKQSSHVVRMCFKRPELPAEPRFATNEFARRDPPREFCSQSRARS